MKCWHCNAELIWGGDHDISHEDDEYQMVTNLSCPNCESIVYVYLPKDMLEIREVGIKERLSLEKHKAKEKAVGLNIQEYISAIHRRKEKAS